MKEKKILTFKSWINDCDKGTRAIALCDETNYFVGAINCVRDSQMGDKDENGVYSRQWWADSVWKEEEASLRAATKDEVELYLKYIDLEEAVDFSDGKQSVKIISKTTCILYGENTVIIELTDLPWWKKLWNFFKH